jgi:phosphomannomutase
MFENEVKNLKKITHPRLTKIGKFSQNLSHYQDDLISRVGKDSCSKIKVALDMGGGVGSLFIPRVFKKIGCEVLPINYIPSNFSRVIDPVVDDLQELSSAVLKNSCQVGFAYDCDADRVVIIDEKGRKLSGDITLMLCIKHAIKKGRIRKIIVSTDTTKGIQEMGENHGVQVVYTKVGESNVVKEMIECGSYIGGEGSSGGVIFSDFVLCRDGVLASSIIAKMIEEEGDLSNIIKELPKYDQLRKSIPSSPNKFKKIINIMHQKFPNSELIDGIKFYPTNNSWVLIRPSNTEKIIRISVEAKSKSQTILIMNYYIKEIEQILNEEL